MFTTLITFLPLLALIAALVVVFPTATGHGIGWIFGRLGSTPRAVKAGWVHGKKSAVDTEITVVKDGSEGTPV